MSVCPVFSLKGVNLVQNRHGIVFKYGGDRHAREEFFRGEKTILLTSVSVVFITVFFPKSLSLLLTLHSLRH